MKSLEAEFKYYLDNQDTLVRQHKGKFVVIKDKQVIGIYSTEKEALQETMKEHELGTFLVHLAEAGEENTSQTFHSRVFFDAKN